MTPGWLVGMTAAEVARLLAGPAAPAAGIVRSAREMAGERGDWVLAAVAADGAPDWLPPPGPD